MNKQRAQVFIATTQGLVRVQSIVPLTDSGIQSVVTIDGSSTLAGISQAYQHFVAKPQGIIHDLFGRKAYRINIASNIDQGESWQLGFFLAHYLFEHNCLSDLANENDSMTRGSSETDIVFIATGRIDTLHYQVMHIDELAKKCLYANPNIVQWQLKKQQICFLAPSQNLRQPIPNSLLKLSPIAHLGELYQFCSLYGLDTQKLRFSDSIDAPREHHVDTIYGKEEYGEFVTIEANLIEDEKVNQHTDVNDHYSADKQRVGKRSLSQYWRINRIRFFIYVTILIGFAYTVISWSGLISGNEGLALQNGKAINHNAIEYVMVGEISQNKSSCMSAKKIELSNGFIALNSHSRPTNLEHLCRLFVVTDHQVKALWLVSDSKAIIALSGVSINQQAYKNEGLLAINRLQKNQDNLTHWAVPLPKNTKQTRSFTLLAFLHTPDEADASSLDSYLYQLHQQGESHDMSHLQGWINKTQSNKPVFMVAQELTFYR